MKTLKETFESCLSEGIIRKKDFIDIELAKSLLKSAEEDLEVSKELKEKYPSFLFRNKYEILRKLISAFLLFDKVKINNHQCLNAYVCNEHPELELNWELLEEFRILRNQISYEGREITLKTWKEYKLTFKLYINLFIKKINDKINDS